MTEATIRDETILECLAMVTAVMALEGVQIDTAMRILAALVKLMTPHQEAIR